jgi:hypothetical protein
MNAPTFSHGWITGLLDAWMIGLIDSPGVDAWAIHLSTNPKIHQSSFG